MQSVISISDLDGTFLTADHHFGHANVIRFCSRPFSNANEMDEAMIANWNATVARGDTVIHLGDFTLTNNAQRYFRRLNGHVYILRLDWHHDRRWLKKQRDLVFTADGPVKFLTPVAILRVPGVKVNGRTLKITLSHYPMAAWEASHYGFPQLHGHSHGRYDGRGLVLDVGMDTNNFRPISLRKCLSKLGVIQ